MFNRISASVGKLLLSRRGSVAIQMGLSLVGLLGVVGLGTEGTFLVYKHRQMQSAADSAALSGAMALSQSYPRDAQSEAQAVAARLGFANGADGATITVNSPPAEGTYAGRDDAVEVVVSQPQQVSMLRLFKDGNVDVSARSVALQQDTGRFCVLALDPSVSQAMYISNNAMITNPDCNVAVNSTSGSALTMQNNSIIRGYVSSPGGVNLSNNAHFDYNENTGEYRDTIRNSSPIDDPYADVELQAAPACTAQSGSGSNNITRNLTPGRFCSGWDFKNNVTLNLSSGTYYIDSKMSIKNNVIINGTNVTLIINGNYAIDIANNATLNLSAPTDGDYAGLVFFGRRDATSTVLQKFSNNTMMNIQGVVYFPNQTLEFDNNGTTSQQGCTHIIGRKIRMMNNVELKNDCEGTGVKPISPPAQLVE